MIPQHTDRFYEENLRHLKKDILTMANLVEEMIAKSVKALVERNTAMAEEIIEKDSLVNELEVQIDDQCLKLLALHQPVASDLRFVAVGLKISTDMERIGDLAVNICEHTLFLNKEPQLKPYIDLPKLAATSQKMVKDALDSFVNQDVGQARKVCLFDDEADNLDEKIFEELVDLMQREVGSVGRGVRLLSIAKQLERIADHATNIAEEVIFMVQGKDIRHGKKNF